MKYKTIRSIAFAAGLAAIFAFGSTSNTLAQKTIPPGAEVNLTPAQKQVVAAFELRVKNYVKVREEEDGKLPKLSKDSTPEQIVAHKKALEDAVQARRVAAKAGDIFKPDIAAHIRTTLKNEFQGKDRQELRKTIFEAETQGVPLKVNFPYPETKELAEMPPALLLKLPQLPKQVKFRFVGRNLLLVDRENGLIIDYMLNALP